MLQKMPMWEVNDPQTSAKKYPHSRQRNMNCIPRNGGKWYGRSVTFTHKTKTFRMDHGKYCGKSWQNSEKKTKTGEKTDEKVDWESASPGIGNTDIWGICFLPPEKLRVTTARKQEKTCKKKVTTYGALTEYRWGTNGKRTENKRKVDWNSP